MGNAPDTFLGGGGQLTKKIIDSGEVGEMEYDIFKFKITSLTTYEKDLILVKWHTIYY